MLVQKLRLKRGWSQQQLADLSGVSVRTIQRLERGQPASTETLKSLASVFETDFSTLQAEPDMTHSDPDSKSISTSTSGASAEEVLAFQHVRRLKRFYVHLGRYVLVIGALTAINFLSPERMWVQWPALGWGIGLLFHAASTFELLPFFGADWEKRQAEKRLGRPL
jgi:transcriptional regulator with XRE-family HTH domain